VVFSDFQCPFCSRLANTLHEVIRDYPQDVKLVFKQLPLPMHQNAEPAARASLAAHRQGKFWELHDQLFANQGALGDAQLATYASGLGLDMERWRKDYQDPAVRQQVADDKAMAATLQVSSTPTFYVNGKLFKGAQQPEQVRAILDQEILEARKLLDAGVPRHELYARFLHKGPALPDSAPKPAPAAAGDAAPPAAAAPDPDKDHVHGEASRVPNYAVPTEGRPAKGPEDALVTIVEFGAFDCDECRAIQPTLQRVLAKYPRDVRLVFRQLPASIPARRMAQIALAAHAQGKFWETHDVLMTSEDFTAEEAADLAKRLGLDADQFGKDLRSREPGGPLMTIQRDVDVVDVFRGEAPAPLFFVNGRYLDRNPSFEDFDALVQEEKAKAEKFMADKGVPKAGLYDAMRQTWRGAANVQRVLDRPTSLEGE
ncbi:MAG: thioredoxin domain-containing protein, partial [Myxococcales bacterium]|nr:thioredoxin domain-containing protein [Myxococcales bacterium]